MKRRKRKKIKTFPTVEQVRKSWQLAKRADPLLLALMEAEVKVDENNS